MKHIKTTQRTFRILIALKHFIHALQLLQPLLRQFFLLLLAFPYPLQRILRVTIGVPERRALERGIEFPLISHPNEARVSNGAPLFFIPGGRGPDMPMKKRWK